MNQNKDKKVPRNTKDSQKVPKGPKNSSWPTIIRGGASEASGAPSYSAHVANQRRPNAKCRDRRGAAALQKRVLRAAQRSSKQELPAILIRYVVPFYEKTLKVVTGARTLQNRVLRPALHKT